MRRTSKPTWALQPATGVPPRPAGQCWRIRPFLQDQVRKSSQAVPKQKIRWSPAQLQRISRHFKWPYVESETLTEQEQGHNLPLGSPNNPQLGLCVCRISVRPTVLRLFVLSGTERRMRSSMSPLYPLMCSDHWHLEWWSCNEMFLCAFDYTVWAH